MQSRTAIPHRRGPFTRRCLQTIMEELLCVIGEPLADIEGAYYGPEFDRALSWHAARLTDLGRDIKFPFRV